ncbi:MAG: ribose-5-phosphate isomerase RpiA [Candidatus Methanomethylophilaceae archaeon]|jgi:ribose 5-phosphate isomerase A
MTELKRLAAEKAVEDVEDGMTVGLGTGSTAYYAILKVAELVKSGYKLRCVATSVQTEEIAQGAGIEVLPLDAVESIDITIDGADEVDSNLQLVKGLGGALLREKIVAVASKSVVIIVDESKLVEKLGTRSPLPVEVLPFGESHTRRSLEKLGCEPVLRMRDGSPFVTDGGNHIYDCRFESIDSPFFLESRINTIPGVVENGLFLNIATKVVVATSDGIKINEK